MGEKAAIKKDENEELRRSVSDNKLCYHKIPNSRSFEPIDPLIHGSMPKSKLPKLESTTPAQFGLPSTSRPSKHHLDTH